MEQRGFRTYQFSANPSIDLLSVFIADNRQKFAVVWALDGQQQPELFIKVDGDERAITSAGLSADRRLLLVTVEYERGPTGSTRPDSVCMPLVDLMAPEVKAHVMQRDIHAQVNRARNQGPVRQVIMCYTQTHHDLNYQ
jgi:hypothetical protein